MARRRKKAPYNELQPTTLLCGECGLAYHGPHKGDVHHPYRPAERPDYPYSQGLCTSRTCIRSHSRKKAEWLRSFGKGKTPDQPDSYWRTYAREEEAYTEASVRAGSREWDIPPQDIVEDWGSKEPNRDNIVAGTNYEPLEPPIDFDAQEGGDE